LTCNAKDNYPTPKGFLSANEVTKPSRRLKRARQETLILFSQKSLRESFLPFRGSHLAEKLKTKKTYKKTSENSTRTV